MTELVYVRGLPGSGKSTFSKKIADNLGHSHVEADQFFTDESGKYNFDRAKLPDAHWRCMIDTIRNLAAGKSVVVANTGTTREEILQYREIANKCGADFVVVKMTGDFGSVHGVPAVTIDRMKRRWEDWPDEITTEQFLTGGAP